MARKSKTRSSVQSQRNAVDVANRTLIRLLAEPWPSPPVNPTRLTTEDFRLDDRRRYNPDPFRSYVRVGGGPADVRAAAPGRGAQLNSLRFGDPRGVVVCARRGRRREVLFALRRTAKGSGARKRRRTVASQYSCRR